MKKLRNIKILISIVGLFFYSQAIADPPDWVVQAADFVYSANLIGQLHIDQIESNQSGNIIGIFYNDELRGVGTTQLLDGKLLYFFDVYSNTYSGELLTIKAYLPSADVIRESPTTFTFAHSTFTGSLSTPFLINVYTPMEVSITEEVPICGDNPGQLTVRVNHGIAPLSYRWSQGSDMDKIHPIAGGNYSVTITDAVNRTIAAHTSIAYFSACLEENCVDAYRLFSHSMSNVKGDFSTIDSMTIAAEIKNGSLLKFSAGKSITLSPPFFIEQGSTATFSILDCATQANEMREALYQIDSLDRRYILNEGRIIRNPLELKLYPNPLGNGLLTVEWDEPLLEGAGQLPKGGKWRILSLDGRVLQEDFDLMHGQNRLNLLTEGWRKGSYLVVVEIGGYIGKSKFIKIN